MAYIVMARYMSDSTSRDLAIEMLLGLQKEERYTFEEAMNARLLITRKLEFQTPREVKVRPI